MNASTVPTTTHKAEVAVLGYDIVTGIDQPVPRYAKACSICGRRVARLYARGTFVHAGGNRSPRPRRPKIDPATLERVYTAVLAMADGTFTTALIETEGQGFSCTEIEEYCWLMECVGYDDLANEVRLGHAQADDDEDDWASHRALLSEGSSK